MSFLDLYYCVQYKICYSKIKAVRLSKHTSDLVEVVLGRKITSGQPVLPHLPKHCR